MIAAMMLIVRTDRLAACLSFTPAYLNLWSPQDGKNIALCALEAPHRIPGLGNASFLSQDAKALPDGSWLL